MLKRNLLILTILSFSSFFFVQEVNAQTSLRTRVGNPTETTSNIVKAAQDVKTAYDSCSNGYTHQKPGLGECLSEQLLGLGYNEQQVSAYEQRRSIAFPDGCTQCVGYVGTVLSLLSSSPNTILVPSAASIANFSSITAGDTIYDRLPAGEPLQPGDIGAIGGGFGHVLIVKEPDGNMAFHALESNGRLDCRVTDNRRINRDGYVFFRQR